jgi:hypothetical protein
MKGDFMFKFICGSFKTVFVLGVLFALVFLAMGWVTNVVRFVKADFEAPYKNEIVRGIGIPFVPLGVVMGYIHIDDSHTIEKDFGTEK